MYAVTRTYSGKGAKELFGVLERHKDDVEKTLRSVKGFESYVLVRNNDGGFSVTVCKDKSGADESMRVAKEWITKHAGNTGAAPPSVTEGQVIIETHH